MIDSDGHTVEFEPALLDYIKKVGGESLLQRYRGGQGGMGPSGTAKLPNSAASGER